MQYAHPYKMHHAFYRVKRKQLNINKHFIRITK